MACLVRDKVTGLLVGYEEYTEEQLNKINAQGNYECIPFYDKGTCRKVLGVDKEKEG